MVPITAVQRKVLDFILLHVEQTGCTPTLREVAQYCGWKSVASAQDVVAALRKKGLLQAQSSQKARQLLPVQKQRSPHRSAKDSGSMVLGFEVPLLGKIQAGLPQEAVEAEPEKSIYFPQTWAHKSQMNTDYFALEVQGYSMLNAGFLPKDILLVQKSNTAHHHDIVVANVTNQNEATVKRFAAQGSQLYQRAREAYERRHQRNPSQLPLPPLAPAYLVPENPDFEPIPFGIGEADKLLGIVRSLWRPHINVTGG